MKSKMINGVRRIKKKSGEGCFALLNEEIKGLVCDYKLKCLLKYKFSLIPESVSSAYLKYAPDEICPKPKTVDEYLIEKNSSEANR